MVGDLILDHLELAGMSLRHQLTQQLQRAEMVLDRVMVHCVVAVVVRVGTPGLVAFVHAVEVVVPGGEPQRRDPQLLKVGEMIDNPAQVAAMEPA